MKIMQTITSLLLVSIISGIFPGTVFADYSDVTKNDTYFASVSRLADLGIVSGYEDGLFHPEREITRAEFARILVGAMDAETEAKTYGISSKFYDVPQGHWAVPYIAYITSKGIFSGYPDGSFKPSNTITYAEILTIAGRMLGYTEETIGAYWPTNYIEAAKGIGLTEGLSFSGSDAIHRGEAAIIVDRALFSKMSKSTNEPNKILLENMGYTIIEDTLVLATGDSDNTLFSDEVRLDNNTVYTTTIKSGINSGDLLKYAVINQDGDLVCKKNYGEENTPDEMTVERVVVNSVNGNEIEYTGADKTKGTYRFENTFTTYLDSQKSTYQASASQIKAGTALTFYGDKNGNWKFALIDTAEDVRPVRASHDYTDADTTLEGITIDKNALVVYRDGKSATLADIAKNDVVYYNTRINTMDVYTKKVTGIYYDAYPDKAYVTEVTVAGKTYKIGETTATKMLDATEGSFDIGDKVTLLLGKNDEVAFVTELNDFDYMGYGVVVSSGQRIAESGANEGSSEIYVELYMPDGETYEYVADKDYSDYKGELVSLKYNDKKVSLKTINTSANVYGKIDYKDRTIGNKTVLKDVKIIQRVSPEGDENVKLEVLNFETLEIPELYEENVINTIPVNKFGDIGIMYVTGLSGSVSYGVVASRSDKAPYSYTIYGEDQGRTYTSNVSYGVTVGAGVLYKETSAGKIDNISALYKLKSATKIDAIEGSRIMLGSTIYKMSAGVVIVDITDRNNYKVVSLAELESMKNLKSINIYSEKSEYNDGIVRVITITSR